MRKWHSMMDFHLQLLLLLPLNMRREFDVQLKENIYIYENKIKMRDALFMFI